LSPPVIYYNTYLRISQYVFTYVSRCAIIYRKRVGDRMARKKFTTTLDEELIKQIKMRAVEENTDVSKIIEKLIRDFLSKPTKK